jgi:hypothetical protein
MVDLAAPPSMTDFDAVVAARARLVSFSPRHRKAYVSKVASLIHELGRDMGSTGSLHPAVVESALAVAARAEVIVLVGVDELSAEDRAVADVLADELSLRGLAVLLVGGQSVPMPDAREELVESGAGVGHE